LSGNPGAHSRAYFLDTFNDQQGKTAGLNSFLNPTFSIIEPSSFRYLQLMIESLDLAISSLFYPGKSDFIYF